MPILTAILSSPIRRHSRFALVWLWVIASLSLPAQNEQKGELLHTLYLVGDAGKIDRDGGNQVITAMKPLLEKESTESSLVYLGDNIYPNGLPEKNHKDRKEAEQILVTQMEPALYYNGTIYFIPGNHDWNFWGSGGQAALDREENYIEGFYSGEEKIWFYPDDGCPDPIFKMVADSVLFVFLDTQWWLQKKKNSDHCRCQSVAAVEEEIINYLADHSPHSVVFFGHHPLVSNGNHGGKFSWNQHIFPLREMNKNLWIPLPLVGSIYPLSRMMGFTNQDLTNSKNKGMKKDIERILSSIDRPVIYVSGHEHNLQYFDLPHYKQIVSGAGSKTSYLKKNDDLSFGTDERGFARVLFYSASQWLEFYGAAESGDLKMLYRTCISCD